MDIKSFNEAIYASSNGVIVERRKSIIVPVLVLLAGVALLVANYLIEGNSDTDNLKSTLVLFGGLISIVGIALCGVGLFGSGEPYHTADRCFLVRKQYSFERNQHNDIVKRVETGNKAALDSLKESDIAGITILCYHSPKSEFCAMQAFEYEDFVYSAITKLQIKQ